MEREEKAPDEPPGTPPGWDKKNVRNDSHPSGSAARATGMNVRIRIKARRMVKKTTTLP